MSESGGESERRFDLDTANRMLPDLREALERMRRARQVILDSGERVREASTGNGGGAEANEYQEAVELLGREVERISAEGIILRDVETGLLDFPAEREGRTVHLCWRLGEDRIGFWHPPDTGFAGRRPL